MVCKFVMQISAARVDLKLGDLLWIAEFEDGKNLMWIRQGR